MTRPAFRPGGRTAWTLLAVLGVWAGWRGTAPHGAALGVRDGEAARVDRRLAEEFGTPRGDVLLLSIRGLPVTADADSGRALLRTLLAPIAAHPAVLQVVSPGHALDSLLIGAPATNAVALVVLRGGTGVADAAALRLRGDDIMSAWRDRLPALSLRWTGRSLLFADLADAGTAEVRRAEWRAAIPLLLVAWWAFGGWRAALGALALAAVVVATGLGLGTALQRVIPDAGMLRLVLPLVGIGLAVDYALYLQRHGDRRVIRRAALLVTAGFAALLAAPTAELRAAGAGGIAAALLAAAVAATWPVAPRADAERGPSRWHGWVALVVRRRGLALLCGTLPLAILAWYATGLRLGTPLTAWLPDVMPSTAAIADLRAMRRTALLGTAHVLLRLPAEQGVLTPVGWEALRRTTLALRNVPGVAEVRSLTTIGTGERIVAEGVLPEAVRGATMSVDRRTALLEVIPEERLGEAGMRDLIARLRAQTPIHAGSTLEVGGPLAHALDYERAAGALLRRTVPFALGVTFLALLLMFRAPWLALKAVVLNALVVAAALGATVLVHQPPGGSLFPTVPLLAVIATFAVSMDYELFLLAGVRAARDRGVTGTAAVVEGVAATSGTIVRAAAIMVVLLLAFAAADLAPLRIAGFTLAVAVALDATLVRGVVAPALLALMAEWNWWPGDPPDRG